jgi:hypothetical protein
MKLLLIVIVLVLLALLWLFYAKFTRKGAVPLAKAFRDFTTWFGLLGVAGADWVLQLLQWVAGFWDQLATTVGPALSAPGMDKFVMFWSALMLALKFKGQTQLPRPKIPDFPDPTDAAGA